MRLRGPQSVCIHAPEYQEVVAYWGSLDLLDLLPKTSEAV